MDKLTIIIATKNMLYAFLEGNHPVYGLITLLKAENPNKCLDSVPFLSPFHTQCVVMSAICKRSRGGELGEVLVAGGVIPESSVDRALKGKHYKRGLRCLRHKVSSIILARHGVADRMICVNDPYDAAYSTKDDERGLRVQGKAHVPNTYMKLADPFP